MMRSSSPFRVPRDLSPRREFVNRLGVAMMVLWPAAILLLSGSATSRIHCTLETNTCVVADMLAGMTVKSTEFPASEVTDAIIQGASIGNARGSGTHGAYFVLLGSRTGRTYATAERYDARDAPALVRKHAEAKALIARQCATFSDGPKYDWRLLLPAFLLLGIAAYLTYRAIVDHRGRTGGCSTAP